MLKGAGSVLRTGLWVRLMTKTQIKQLMIEACPVECDKCIVTIKEEWRYVDVTWQFMHNGKKAHYIMVNVPIYEIELDKDFIKETAGIGMQKWMEENS